MLTAYTHVTVGDYVTSDLHFVDPGIKFNRD